VIGTLIMSFQVDWNVEDVTANNSSKSCQVQILFND
jgi:hypothetical protein